MYCTVGCLRFHFMSFQDSYCLTGYTRDVTEQVIIPKEVNGFPVTHIARQAFAGCTKLKNLVVPESVFEIGERAFQECINLKKVKIESYVIEICCEAFLNCYRLREFTANFVKLVSGSTFRNCKNLYVVDCTFEKTIPNGTFYNCESIESLRIGANSVIKDNAFERCRRMKLFVFDGNVTMCGNAETFIKKRQIYCPSWTTFVEWAYYGTSVFVDTALPSVGFTW